MPIPVIESPAMVFSNIFPTLFRYAVLIGLYMFVFKKFTSTTIQFILFIAIFILNFFTLVFLVRDTLATPLLVKSLFDLYTDKDPVENQNIFTKYFMSVIVLTVLLFICSIAIILAVFDYSKKGTNNFQTYTMTPPNVLLLNEFKDNFKVYMKYLAMFVYFIICTYSHGRMKVLLFNIGCLVFTAIILKTSIVCCMKAVKFLDNKKYKRQIYQ